MTFQFDKLVGAGNDFVFIESSQLNSTVSRRDLAVEVCNRQWGIGADGLVIFEVIDLDQAQFRWDFYNNDGSSAEMCGNAARCAALYCKKKFNKDNCSIESAIGTLTGECTEAKDPSISWTIENTTLVKKTIPLDSGKQVSGYFLNTGVPHFVVINEDQNLNGRDCLLLQDHEDFKPDSTNVTLVSNISGNSANTKSFERGVRDFTLACGTGVIASAFVLRTLNSNNTQRLTAPGGTMTVTIQDNKVKLSGPADIIFSGEYGKYRGSNV